MYEVISLGSWQCRVMCDVRCEMSRRPPTKERKADSLEIIEIEEKCQSATGRLPVVG